MATSTFPTKPATRVEFISTEKRKVIVQLALRGKKSKAVLDQLVEPQKTLFERLDSLLTWLDEEVAISPDLKDKTKIEQGLQVITNENYHFPAEFKAKATALLEKWQSQNWGRPAPAVLSPQSNGHARSDSGTEEQDGAQSPRKRRRLSSREEASSSAVMIKKPPVDHPIWGRDGIMHGVALKRDDNRKTKVLNPEYKHLQRTAKVYGHNEIVVGRWFPFQLCAMFHGAHGDPQAGITVGPFGAYSIVVAGHYDALDTDVGDTLYYSGSGAHRNTDPGRVLEPTTGTRSLRSSIDSGQPVRVLRSHSGQSSHAPFKGLRYDGLYLVESVNTRRNGNGGLYERFKLVRQEEDQISLSQCKRRPNSQDLRDYERIELGYQSRR